MHKNLHNPKKSSTFAPDFEIQLNQNTSKTEEVVTPMRRGGAQVAC